MKVQYKYGLKGLGVVLLLGVSLTGYSATEYVEPKVPSSNLTLIQHTTTFVNNTNSTQKIYSGGVLKKLVTPKGTSTATLASLPVLNLGTTSRVNCSDSTWKNDSKPRTCTITASACVCK